MRATTITLKHDPNFVAAKKKDAVSRRAEELVGSSKVYLTEGTLKAVCQPVNSRDQRVVCPHGLEGLRGPSAEHGLSRRFQCGRVLTTLTVATQIIEVYAKPQELNEEDTTVRFTIMIMMLIFLLGFMCGCWSAGRCCRMAHAAGPEAAETTTTRPRANRGARPAPTATAAAAAAEVDEPDFEPDLQEPLLPTAPPTRPTTTTRFPQSIWVTPSGSQYHVIRNCSGLNAASSAAQKFACCACIAEVDGDGLRRRAR